MISILIGLFFVLIDVDLYTEFGVFGILPDFVGYFLIMRGCAQLRKESKKIKKTGFWCMLLAVATVLTYGAKALGLALVSTPLATVFAVIETLAPIVILVLIVEGIREIEIDSAADLKTKWLFRLLVPYGASQVLALVFSVSNRDVKDVFNYAAVACSFLYLALLAFSVRKYVAVKKENAVKESDPPEEG